MTPEQQAAIQQAQQTAGGQKTAAQLRQEAIDEARVRSLMDRAATIRGAPVIEDDRRPDPNKQFQPVAAPTRGSGPAVQIGAPQAAREPGKLQQRAASALSGLTLGYADEAFGAMGAPGAAQRFDSALAAHRENSPAGSVGWEIAGGVLVPGAAFTKGAGWLTNTAKAMGLGGLLGGTYAMGNAEGTVSERLREMPLGVAGGAVGGALSVPAASAVAWAGRTIGRQAGRIFGNRKFFANGQLTEQGMDALREAGLDPEDVSQAFRDHFKRRIAQMTTPEQGARAAAMDEFGIPAYRHNVTGTVDDAAAFHAAARGGSGSPEVNQRVAQAASDQMDAARRAGETIATDFSQGRAFDQGDAAAMTIDRLRTLRDEGLGAAREAYNALEEAGGGLSGNAVAGIDDQVRNAARIGGVEISQDATPNAQQALSGLGRLLQGTERGFVPFMNLERGRQFLNRMRSAAYAGSNGSDQIAMDTVLRQFDDFVADRIDAAMFDGSQEALEQARTARGLWSNYMDTFRGKGAVSRFVQKLVDDDASPDQAVRWLFSASKMGRGGMTSTLARGLKDLMGESSDEWNAIRQAAFRQMVTKPEGTTPMGAQRMSENVLDFLNSPMTRDLAQSLYSAEERRLMARYATALKQMVPPPGAVNYSGTDYQAARRLAGFARGLATALGFGVTGGQPGWGIAAGEAAGALQRAGQSANVSAMLRSAPAVSRPAAPAAGAVAGATGADYVNRGFTRE